MSREIVALVSADDAVAAVRVHADRVHDLLRRSGIGPEDAIEVTDAFATGLVDALAHSPAAVGDMAGWWFGRAIDTARQVGEVAAVPVDTGSASVLAGEGGEDQVRAALAALPEAERIAVLLRDAYDLPLPTVQVAVRRDAATVAGQVAAGRLRLVAAIDGATVPTLAGHSGRLAVSLAALAQLADGSLPSPLAVPLRRHVPSCPACEAVLTSLSRGRRMLAGLPVVAMPDRARQAMLDRVGSRAVQVLPSYDEILRAVEHDDEDRPAIPRLAAAGIVVLAALLGVAIAALSRSSSGSAAPLGAPTIAPLVTQSGPAPTLSLPPLATQSARPAPTIRVIPPPTTAPPTTAPPSSAPPSATATSPAPTATLLLTPDHGASGAVTSATGAGFAPDSIVTITYPTLTDPRTATTVTTDQAGGFTTTIAPSGPPGPVTVSATDATRTATATYTIQ